MVTPERAQRAMEALPWGAQSGSRAATAGSHREQTLDALEHPRTYVEQQPSRSATDDQISADLRDRLHLARGMDYVQPKRASEHLEKWCQWASHSRLAPFAKLAKTVKRHKDGILAYVETGLSNGVVEGINNKIRAIIRRAYGFRNPKAFMAMILLCCGGMEFTPPLPAAA